MLDAAGIVVMDTITPTTAPDFARPSRRCRPLGHECHDERAEVGLDQEFGDGLVPREVGGGDPVQTASRECQEERGGGSEWESQCKGSEGLPHVSVHAVHQRDGHRGHGSVVGETIIAPTIRTGLFVRMATQASSPASTISRPKLTENVDSSLVRAATSSHTTVSISGVRIVARARSAALEMTVSISVA